MLSTRCKEIVEHGDKLFSDRASLMSFWQEVADNFYPERASFTYSQNLGTDFASRLDTSYPLLARRDLGNAIGSMLRPAQKPWFHMTVANAEPDHEGRRWLEKANIIQRRAMSDRRSQFSRATKEADHDFAAFGQAVISTELAPSRAHLLYRTWHLRDVAWCEGADGTVSEVHVKWRPYAVQLNELMRGNVAPQVKEMLAQKPYECINVRWVVVPFDRYYPEGPPKGKPATEWVKLLVDVDNKFEMEVLHIHSPTFAIPRWQTVSDSQYAYSPAVVCALPDARLIQSMTRVLLDAGEKAVSPPMIAVREALRSDANLYAGGLTYVDAKYDERLGEVLRPLTLDTRGLPIGMDMREEVKRMIAEAFFLNKLNLPPYDGAQMTAYEVGQRVQEYIRQALPIFEPMEDQYNAALCERTFDELLRNGAFGPIDMIPASIRGAEIEFRFESPLHEAVEREKVQIFGIASNLLAQAQALDPTATFVVDAKTALRDALSGGGVPVAWTRSEDDVEKMAADQMAQQKAAQTLAAMQQGADVANKLGNTPGMQATL